MGANIYLAWPKQIMSCKNTNNNIIYLHLEVLLLLKMFFFSSKQSSSNTAKWIWLVMKMPQILAAIGIISPHSSFGPMATWDLMLAVIGSKSHWWLFLCRPSKGSEGFDWYCSMQWAVLQIISDHTGLLLCYSHLWSDLQG